jgi:hypothetical protein
MRPCIFINLPIYSMKIIVVFLMGFLCSCQDFGYHEYISHYYKSDVGIYKVNRLLTETEKQNIKRVFSFYNIHSREKDKKFFYKGNVSTELLRNYTSKANASIWLLIHKK